MSCGTISILETPLRPPFHDLELLLDVAKTNDPPAQSLLQVDMNAQISQADMFGKDCVERPTGSCRPRQVPPMGFVDWRRDLFSVKKDALHLLNSFRCRSNNSPTC